MASMYDGQSEASEAEESWMVFFQQCRVGYTWCEINDLLPVCTLATEYPRLLYTTVPFLKLAKYSQHLANKLSQEREFWLTFGNREQTHSYSICSHDFCDAHM